MNENDKNNRSASEEEIAESNAAKRLRMTGADLGGHEDFSDIPRDFGSRLHNFWYHHKWKVIITAFFAFALAVVIGQMVKQKDPDVFILYAGPDYIAPMDSQAFCAVMEEMMTEDYNRDGEKKIRLTDIVFYTAEQAEVAEQEARERGEDNGFFTSSEYLMANSGNLMDKFLYEVSSDDAMICILAESQYEQIMINNGFVPLVELFGEREIKGAVDAYGVRLCETNFYEYYNGVRVFPDDAVLALRKPSALTVFTGNAEKSKARYEYHKELFMRMADFRFPEGYTPPSADQ